MKFNIGDRFVFNVELMKHSGYSDDDFDDKVHEICSVEYHDGLGEIIGWWDLDDNEYLPAQCNAVWIIKSPR